MSSQPLSKPKRQPKPPTDRRLLRWLFVVVLACGGRRRLRRRLRVRQRPAPAGTEVAGVDVGGRSPADAPPRPGARAATHASTTRSRSRSTGATFTIDPEKAGLDVDVAASIAQVPVGRSWNPAGHVGERGRRRGLRRGRRQRRRPAHQGARGRRRGGRRARGRRRGPVHGRSGAEPTYPEKGLVLDVDGRRGSGHRGVPLRRRSRSSSSGSRTSPRSPPTR